MGLSRVFVSRWVRSVYVSEVPLPCDLSKDACDVTYPLNRMTDRWLWKHYLPATTVADGNKKEIVLRGVFGSCHYSRDSVLTTRLLCKACSLMNRFDGNWLRRVNTVSWIAFLFFCKHLHIRGRPRNSVGFVCLHSFPLKKIYNPSDNQKISLHTCTHTHTLF